MAATDINGLEKHGEKRWISVGNLGDFHWISWRFLALPFPPQAPLRRDVCKF
jgi:hypothetical protein